MFKNLVNSRCFVFLNSFNVELPMLFCFPHAGGSAEFFRGLANCLEEQMVVIGVQYPGRFGRFREKLVDSVSALASQVAQELTNASGGRVVFFGHSMGALVSFEVARLLSKKGKFVPSLLIVSGRSSPKLKIPCQFDLFDDSSLLTELSNLGGTHDTLLSDPDMRELIIRVTRNDYYASATYKYLPDNILECPITAFWANTDRRVSRDSIALWNEETKSEFEIIEFSGGHFYLQDQWQIVANRISVATHKYL